MALGYFERVDVTEEDGATPDRIVVNFEVAERPTGTFQVGAGFSSQENFMLTGQIQQENLFGRGQSLGAAACSSRASASSSSSASSSRTSSARDWTSAVDAVQDPQPAADFNARLDRRQPDLRLSALHRRTICALR